MSKNMFYEIHKDPVLKKRIRDQIAGFKKMNEFVLNEQRENLPKMTFEKSNEIYEGLWTMWEFSRKKYPDYKKLDRMHIEELVKRRKIWDRIAKGLKSLNDPTL